MQPMLAVVWHFWIAAVLVPRRHRARWAVMAAATSERRVDPLPEGSVGRVADPVDWGLAEKVAVRVAGREPLAASYHYDRLTADFDELTAQAEALVERATGSALGQRPGPGPGRRPQRLGAGQPGQLRPAAAAPHRADGRAARRAPRGRARPWAGSRGGPPASRSGALLGWMATRVLGQYDLLIIEDEDPDDQDLVYYVGPNVLALEKRFGFPPREFRLWLALHEVTHRAQFTGVPVAARRTSCRSSTRRSTRSTPTPSGSSTPPPG